MFKEYTHIERYGTSEVEGINLGTCYVFPKIDGTNASVWLDESLWADNDEIACGSRTKQLSETSDNAGFWKWVQNQTNLKDYLKANPTHILYGEWLVPHSLKTYRPDAWRQFYVFDVYDTVAHVYQHYNWYAPVLEEHGLNFIPPISIITNGDYDKFVGQTFANGYLIEDGKGVGEGIVIKRYDFVNKYGRQCFAKIVTNAFKEKQVKTLGASEMNGKKMVEIEIVNEFVTKTLVDKEYEKIAVTNGGWSSKNIPQLLNTVYYELIREESWNFIKKFKHPTINFKRLQQLVMAAVKVHKSDLF